MCECVREACKSAVALDSELLEVTSINSCVVVRPGPGLYVMKPVGPVLLDLWPEDSP